MEMSSMVSRAKTGTAVRLFVLRGSWHTQMAARFFVYIAPPLLDFTYEKNLKNFNLNPIIIDLNHGP